MFLRRVALGKTALLIASLLALPTVALGASAENSRAGPPAAGSTALPSITPSPVPTVTQPVPPPARTLFNRSMEALRQVVSANYTETYMAEAPGRVQQAFVATGSADLKPASFEATVQARSLWLVAPKRSTHFTEQFRVVGQNTYAVGPSTGHIWKRVSPDLIAVIYAGNLAAGIPLDNPLSFELRGPYARIGVGSPRWMTVLGSTQLDGSPVWRLQIQYPETARRGPATVQLLIDESTYTPLEMTLSATGGRYFPSVRMQESIELRTINVPVSILPPRVSR